MGVWGAAGVGWGWGKTCFDLLPVCFSAASVKKKKKKSGGGGGGGGGGRREKGKK